MLRLWLDECAGRRRPPLRSLPGTGARGAAVSSGPAAARPPPDLGPIRAAHPPLPLLPAGEGWAGLAGQVCRRSHWQFLLAACARRSTACVVPALCPQALATVQATRQVLQAGAASGFAAAFALAAAQALLPPAPLPLAGMRGATAASLPLLLGSAALAAGAAQLLLGGWSSASYSWTVCILRGRAPACQVAQPRSCFFFLKIGCIVHANASWEDCIGMPFCYTQQRIVNICPNAFLALGLTPAPCSASAA